MHARQDARARRRRLLGLVAALCALLPVSLPALPASGVGTTSGVRPRVLGVTPNVVRGRGDVRIAISGSGFEKGDRVVFDGVEAHGVIVRTPHSIVVVAPPGVGLEHIRVQGPSGASALNGRSVLEYRTRVLIIGDSLGIDLGWGMQTTLERRLGVSAVDLSIGSTGLSRPDYYNWPVHLRADIAAVHPDVVLTMLGTNDMQPIVVHGGDVAPMSEAWDAAYAQRVEQIASIVRAHGEQLLWSSLPRMAPGAGISNSWVEHLFRLDSTTLASHAGVAFVDAWALFSRPDGTYDPDVTLGPGVAVPGHFPDGVHLAPAGATAIDDAAMLALAGLVR